MKISVATVAVWLAFCHDVQPPAPQPQPQKCCAECAGTGMVWSGDRLVRSQCPCPASCKCAENRPKSASLPCQDGKCGVAAK